MPFVFFEDGWRTGDDQVDRRIADVFDALNRLHDAMVTGQKRAAVRDALLGLKASVREQFELEDCVVHRMTPQRHCRREERDRLSAKLTELDEALEVGSSMWAIATLLAVREWLLQSCRDNTAESFRTMRS